MKCSACPQSYHPATGHAFNGRFRLCGTCAKDFYQWYKLRMKQMQARIKRKGKRDEESFHDNAMRSNK